MAHAGELKGADVYTCCNCLEYLIVGNKHANSHLLPMLFGNAMSRVRPEEIDAVINIAWLGAVHNHKDY